LCLIEVDQEALDSSDVLTSEHRDTNNINSPPPPQEQKGDTPDAHESRPQPPSDKHPVARRLHPLDPNAPPRPASESSRASTWQPGASSDSVTAAKRVVAVDVLALPAVRHFARESGVDIALLASGSGKNGRVERVDVERYLAGGKFGSVGEQPTAVSHSPLVEDDIVVELGRTRYGMWKAMEKARIRIVSGLAMAHQLAFYRAWRYLTLGERTVPGLFVLLTCIYSVIRPLSI